MKDLKPVLRPIWIAALVRIRRAGRHLRFLSRWLASILRLGARMWPVSTVWLILSLCFLLPGLASSQTFEAMLQYAGGDAQVGISWPRLLTTIIFTLCFAAALKATAYDLLEKYPGREKTSPLRLRIVLSICQWFPALAIAIAFFRMQSAQAASFHPFRTMAVVLLAFQVAAAFLGKAARRNGAIVPEQFRRRRHLTAFVAIFVVVAFFGAPDKDRWLGMPISSVAAAQSLGPINVLLLFLATFLFLTTALIAAGRFIRVPIVVILSCLALVLGWYDLNDNHKVRQARENSEKAPTVENAFDSWMAGRADKDQFDEYPVILVSAEGGGIRAAFFTAITLARIADRCPRMSHHIFAISGVSGGAVGAALFAAAMKAWPPDVGNSRCDLKAHAPSVYEEALAQVLQDDHLSPLLARMLFPDIAQQFLPFPVESFDRQMGLEFSLERSFRRVFGQDLLSRSIYNLRPDDAHPAVPYLFLNTTEVQSGRRFVVTPLFLQSPPFGGAEDWHWLDWNFGPPVSAAAGVSARFPVFSPAGYSYNNGRKARYVDGGYIDNSGAVSLSEIFTALYLLREEKYLADENGKKATKFAMMALHIGNAPACDIVRDETSKREAVNRPAQPRCDPNEQAAPAGGLGELLSPVEAVIGVRSAQVEYNLLQFHNRIDLGTDLDRFDFHARVQMYDRGIPVPLGWLLSSRVARELRSQLDAAPGEPECKKQVHSSNLCELAGAVAGATWRK